MKKRIVLIIMVAVAISSLAAAELTAQCGRVRAEKAHEGCTAEEKKTDSGTQKTCPVMGGRINREYYVDVKGKRVYACCEGCLEEIKKNPEKYLQKIEENGEMAADAPVVVCGKCGEMKGSEECCREGAKKCPECGLIKGSPGCCKLPGKGKDAVICGGCGKIEGSDESCIHAEKKHREKKE
jgi:YHS domain-containing protein